MSVLLLTPRRLVVYVAKHYGYVINSETATEILIQCEETFEDEFSEDELKQIVKEYIK